MTIPVSKVRALCTSSEVALVRASRKGELDAPEHGASEAARGSAPESCLKNGRPSAAINPGCAAARLALVTSAPTHRLKEEIFREALTRFEERLPKAAAAAEANSPKKSKPKTKSDRNAEHRSARAVVRQDMTAAKRSLKARRDSKK